MFEAAAGWKTNVCKPLDSTQQESRRIWFEGRMTPRTFDRMGSETTAQNRLKAGETKD